jgi:hypothetical protein
VSATAGCCLGGLQLQDLPDAAGRNHAHYAALQSSHLPAPPCTSPCPPAHRLDPNAASAAAAFRYLSQSGVYSLTDVDDSQEFRHTLEAMRIVGLQQPDVEAGGSSCWNRQ